MVEEVQTIATLVQGGGTAALIAALYFIVKAEGRLARIEKALDKYLAENSKGD